MIRVGARVLVTVVGLLVMVEGGARPALGAGAVTTELLPLPEPALEGVEDAVRRQLIERRAAAADLIGSATGPDGALAEVYGSLGQLYFAYEIMDAAEVCLLNASSLDPSGFSWKYLLGALYTRSGEVDEALANLGSAAVLRPDDMPTQLRLGRLYLDLARLDEAGTHLSPALEARGTAAAAHHGLGRIAQERGQWRTALEHLERALELQPGASSVHYLLGIAYRELGEMAAARRHLGLNGHAPVLFADPEVDRLDALIEGGRYYLQLGELALGRGNTTLALKAFREAVSRGPGDARAHYNLGLTLVKTGLPSEAVHHLQQAVQLDSDYRDAHFNLGVLLANVGRMAEARGSFSRVLEIDPSDEEARLALARSLIWLGRGGEAQLILDEMLEKDPGNPEVLLALAQCLEGLGRAEEARSRLAALLEDARDASSSARAHEHLSRLALAGGARPAAIEHLRAAVEIDPRLPGAFERLGALLGQEGAFAAAAVAYAQAVDAEPGSVSLRFGLAMAVLLSGRSGDAVRVLEEGLAVVGDELPLRHLLARILATAPEAAVRDGSRALEIATQVERARPTAEHAETVAMALAEVGNFDGAADWQERALELAATSSAADLERTRRRLELYRRGEPCRSPWLAG